MVNIVTSYVIPLKFATKGDLTKVYFPSLDLSSRWVNGACRVHRSLSDPGGLRACL